MEDDLKRNAMLIIILKIKYLFSYKELVETVAQGREK